MRTTPISQWLTQASEFDSRILSTAEQILGAPLSDDAYDQASVSPRLGGLGLRKVVDHAEGAFVASWHCAQTLAEEKWLFLRLSRFPLSLSCVSEDRLP